MADANVITSSTPNGARNNFAAWLGWRFVVGASSKSIVALGRAVIAGNSQAHTVRIYRESDNAIVATASVATSGVAGGTFARTNITPVTLDANTAYRVVSQETNGGDQWNDFAAALALASGFSLAANSATYSIDGTSWTNAGGAGDAYVPPTFWYDTGGGAAAAVRRPVVASQAVSRAAVR